MKKPSSSKDKSKTRTRDDKSSTAYVDFAHILRTVGDNEAFYFHEAVGRPTGDVARSLSDFLQKMKSIKLESVAFHFERRDFQNWAEKILGDSKLASELDAISASGGNEVRTRICKIVKSRIKELSEPPLARSTDVRPIILLSSSPFLRPC
jgi:hypothetical protein